MTISPEWIVVGVISAIFILGFLIGYTLGRLEANKLFDLRDERIQLKRSREYWANCYDDQMRYTDELREKHNQAIEELLAKEEEREESKRTG